MFAPLRTAGTQAALTASATRVKGYEILRRAVPAGAADRALRHVHLHIVRYGAAQERLSEFLWNAHWFPELKWDDEIAGLAACLPARLRSGEICDPQIVLQFPDEPDEVDLVPHVDREPDWAEGRSYLRVVGVALSRNDTANGGLVVWPLDGGEPEPVELDPGDVLVMDPSLPHASGLNRTGGIRYAIYFRFLEPA